jgi:hypothetical protein
VASATPTPSGVGVDTPTSGGPQFDTPILIATGVAGVALLGILLFVVRRRSI